MRIEILLLTLACLSPGLAIRGERRAVRQLRGDKEKEDKDVFTEGKEGTSEDGVEKAPKETKTKDKDSKKDKDDKKSKKGKKEEKCKKAKKGKKSKKDKGSGSVRRYAQVIQGEDTNFCLHSKALSQDECARVKEGDKLPKDGSVKGGLNIELVHKTEQSSDEILQNVNGILSSDTNPRFVGCESLKAPPPSKKQSKSRRMRTHRYLEEYELVPETEDQVDVTGVDFEELDIVTGGCSSQTDLADGLVCDSIRSNVEIYYLTQQDSVSEEDKEDMYNLLVETIYAQAEVGSFGGVGDVASVQVGDTTDSTSNQGDDDTETSERGAVGDVDPSGGETTFENHKVPIMAAAAGFAALFAGGYWYAMGSDDDGDKEKNEQTDDSDSDDDRRAAGQRA